ncbi:MAG TPA: GTP-sensing pleiotropic transcriptional regulator CodY [Bacillota bacterium]|jgi:transcriptional pleiotropic repressor|nr:GTP-sensing pleiotropic transcriptional regulator CodY [Bacillota bacterium]HOB87852.1 GTP-sensing pleiotropic transcriptional regulator CodY [Bacillota bacterium]HOP69079.1 GTP-sensing pleiotropic transcriptional regulator CodY [Bacillota bacterium]HPT34314.1 GTP-sensing pleiotropic transcriptional regulator CodY [Bacillota bacterium]HPZ64804.1 GTP-sensing pleiotropic transcriptional regulator CodY [Bacillota bacterium]
MQERSLLNKVRQINQILQKGDPAPDFREAVRALGLVVGAAVLVAVPDDQVAGSFFPSEASCSLLQQYVESRKQLPPHYAGPLLTAAESRLNIERTKIKCKLKKEEPADCSHGHPGLVTVPIFGGGERLGTMLLHRATGQFSFDDLILAEMGSTLVGMLLTRAREESRQEEQRSKDMASVAFESLSYSEVEAVEEVFRNFKGDEGVVVASKVAGELGITRSVIVNALRKFESAGIIESRSLGMKGTFIRVKNRSALEEVIRSLPRLRSQNEESETRF